MRINEIASAEDQLALWQLISDNTWTAIRQQVETEKIERAEKVAHKKLKPKSGRRKSLPPPTYVSLPPPPTKPPPPQAKTEVGKQVAQQMGGAMKQPQANTNNPQQPNALGMAQLQLNPTNPQTAQQPLTPQQMHLQSQNVGNLAKSRAVTKRL